MKTFALVAILAWSGATAALAEGPPKTVPTSFSFEEIVTLTPAEVVGDTPLGRRQRIPITGGTFSGPGLSGRVIPGGQDWQLLRADGSKIIEAEYMIETDDHVQIHVRNVGVTTPAKDGHSGYSWTVPTFEAPMGKYGWLNDAIFLSTLGPAGDKDHPAVRVTVYKVG